MSDTIEDVRERSAKAMYWTLRRAMDKAGLDEHALAAKLGVPVRKVTRMLLNVGAMTLPQIGDVLWACDLEVYDLSVQRLGVQRFECSANGTTDATLSEDSTHE